MSRIFVHGWGAVSPAGWGAAALRESLAAGTPLPLQSMPQPGLEKPLCIRAVPPPAVKLGFLAHARLRRSSPAAHYAVAAALEALGEDAAKIQSGALRLGIVACTMTGGISYSRRFYQEALQDPATASPLIFPETVFNAPTSHLSAYLNTPAVNYTLVGDAGTFLQGAALAAQWLEAGSADACLVIGMEELDWSAGEALQLFDRRVVYTTGAGALYLKNVPGPAAVELTAVTDSFVPTRRTAWRQTVRQIRAQLPGNAPEEILSVNVPPGLAWPGWQGRAIATTPGLGEAFVATAAWQCVAVCEAIQHWRASAGNVMVCGVGRQSIGARFVNTNAGANLSK